MPVPSGVTVSCNAIRMRVLWTMGRLAEEIPPSCKWLVVKRIRQFFMLEVQCTLFVICKTSKPDHSVVQSIWSLYLDDLTEISTMLIVSSVIITE